MAEEFSHNGLTELSSSKNQPKADRLQAGRLLPKARAMTGRDKQLEERLRQAIEAGDVREIGAIVDLLRFRFGANYRHCFSLARKVSGISAGDWDELLYEADQDEED